MWSSYRTLHLHAPWLSTTQQCFIWSRSLAEMWKQGNIVRKHEQYEVTCPTSLSWSLLLLLNSIFFFTSSNEQISSNFCWTVSPAADLSSFSHSALFFFLSNTPCINTVCTNNPDTAQFNELSFPKQGNHGHTHTHTHTHTLSTSSKVIYLTSFLMHAADRFKGPGRSTW